MPEWLRQGDRHYLRCQMKSEKVKGKNEERKSFLLFSFLIVNFSFVNVSAGIVRTNYILGG